MNVATNELQPSKSKLYRFDVFKGLTRENGKVDKLSSVGHSTHYEGSATYTVYLRMFLKDQFFLLPERELDKPFDFVILTREPSSLPGRKYFWNRIGTAKLLTNQNSGIMRLNFDLLDPVELYLNFHDSTVKEERPAA